MRALIRLEPNENICKYDHGGLMNKIPGSAPAVLGSGIYDASFSVHLFYRFLILGFWSYFV